MIWHDLGDSCGVLELDGPRGLELELRVWWGDGRARGVWLLSQTGAIAWWAPVGAA